MTIFTKDSLEMLRQRVDLPELIGSFIELKRAGAAYKALCPFHDEKSPSFNIQKGDSHYHCFGCGAHGDAIAFLMNFQKFRFNDAVEFLAEKFHVHLEKMEMEEVQGPSRREMQDALEFASRVYHALLLHTSEGHQALQYLFQRGISLEFIKYFELGWAPASSGVLHPLLKSKGISLEIAEVCGLLSGTKEFFSSRILFPIRSPSGFVIGFSGRKIKEETYGGKYVNTKETPIFKKSQILYGLNYSRSRIAKERIALVVEGQIDALQLIYQGLDFTVAGQGTAFGQKHVESLAQLGILTVYLAFDSDKAGLSASAKVGDLFQKEGVEVKIVTLPPGYDPDLYLKEKGVSTFLELMLQGEDYLSFLVRYHSLELNIQTPAGKNELASMLGKQIRSWDQPLMVHESLKKLAELLKVPESLVGVGQLDISNIYLKKAEYAGHQVIDPDWVMETDVLRWLIKQPSFSPLAKNNLSSDAFVLPSCRKLYTLCLEASVPLDSLSLIMHFEEGEGQKLVEEIEQKKIPFDNPNKMEKYFLEAIQKLLDRNCMLKREEIRVKIQSGAHSDEEALLLAEQFQSIQPLKVLSCSST
jgi:DNA primase